MKVKSRKKKIIYIKEFICISKTFFQASTCKNTQKINILSRLNVPIMLAKQFHKSSHSNFSSLFLCCVLHFKIVVTVVPS